MACRKALADEFDSGWEKTAGRDFFQQFVNRSDGAALGRAGDTGERRGDHYCTRFAQPPFGAVHLAVEDGRLR